MVHMVHTRNQAGGYEEVDYMGIMSDCLITPIRYDIIDTRTQQVVASRLTRKRASTKADQLDNAYGAVRYIVKAIWANEQAA